MISLDQALAYWREKNLLTEDKVRELKANIPSDAHDASHRAIGIFSAVGAILVGLGIILFVASNWQVMTPLVKVLLLLLGMLGSGVAGYFLTYEAKTYPKTGFALLFVNVFFYGATIFLIGQIYHLPLDFWWGSLLWFIGTIFMAYVIQSRLHLWLSIPLMLMTLAWFMASSHTGVWSEFGALFDDAGLVRLFPILGFGLLSLGILHRRWNVIHFGDRTIMNWGLFLILFLFVFTTADRTLFFDLFGLHTDPLTMTILVLSVIAGLCAFLWGTFETPEGKWGLVSLAIYCAFTYLLVAIPAWRGFPVGAGVMWDTTGASFPTLSWIFVLHVVLVISFLLVIIWEGTILRSPAFINMGMIGLAFVIILQYFSWAFRQLDRSVAFILGGVVILILSSVLERQRRRIMATLHS